MARHRLPVIVATCLALACGDSNDDVSFPDISSAILATFCWRGNIVPPATQAGVISNTDCDAADLDPTDEGYYEVWRVRVASAQTFTISTSSGFDTYLEVVRINSITGTTVNGTLIAEDDDSGTDLNALLAVTLQPGTDYFVAVSGFDYTETGSYSLVIN